MWSTSILARVCVEYGDYDIRAVVCVGYLVIVALRAVDSVCYGHRIALREARYTRYAGYRWRYCAESIAGIPAKRPHVTQMDVCRPAYPLHVADIMALLCSRSTNTGIPVRPIAAASSSCGSSSQAPRRPRRRRRGGGFPMKDMGRRGHRSQVRAYEGMG